MGTKDSHAVAYTIEQVAELLGCHPKTIRKLCHEGRLGFIELGPRCRRIPQNALDAFLSGEDAHNEG